MLLLQTAFDQEFAAVLAAGAIVAASQQTIRVAGHDCLILMTGMGPRAAREQLVAMLNRIERPEVVLSIGLAGGLQPELKFGEICLIDSVTTVERPSQAVQADKASSDEQGRPGKAVLRHSNQEPGRLGKAVLRGAIRANLERLSSNLRDRLRVQNLVTLESPAFSAHAKRQLGEQTQAALCDMETYAVADECQRRQLPWIGARVVSDAVGDSIPGWILTLPRLMEQKRWLQLLSRVATHPQDLPCLLRLALRMQRLKPILTQLTIDLVTHVLPA